MSATPSAVTAVDLFAIDYSIGRLRRADRWRFHKRNANAIKTLEETRRRLLALSGRS